MSKGILKKMLEARQIIKDMDVKREGKNKFGGYDYFTPDQVSNMVNSACQMIGLLPVFSLQQDEYGLHGELIVYDTEGDETMQTTMRTEKPSIKATNETQQMGGCETYTKRYMLMSAFEIADNNLDFDVSSTTNAKKKEVAEAQEIEDANPEGMTKKKTNEPLVVGTGGKATSKRGKSKIQVELDNIMAEINKAKDKDELKGNAAGFIQQATDAGATEEEIKLIKDAVNSKYEELKK